MDARLAASSLQGYATSLQFEPAYTLYALPEMLLRFSVLGMATSVAWVIEAVVKK